MDEETIRIRTIAEVLGALSKVTQNYSKHLDEGGEQKPYIEAIVELAEELTKMATASRAKWEADEILRKARAM